MVNVLASWPGFDPGLGTMKDWGGGGRDGGENPGEKGVESVGKREKRAKIYATLR